MRPLSQLVADVLDGRMTMTVPSADNDTYKSWEQDQLGILTLLYRSFFFISDDDRPVVDMAWLDLLVKQPAAAAQVGQTSEAAAHGGEPSAEAAAQVGESHAGRRTRGSRHADLQQTVEEKDEELMVDDSAESVASSLDEMAKAGMKASWMAHMTNMNKAYKKEISRLDDVIRACDEGAQ